MVGCVGVHRYAAAPSESSSGAERSQSGQVGSQLSSLD